MEKNSHKILALKYRPQRFEDLIGQDLMVQTIVNSIKSQKIPNAYLLTGIRGVGKTTTARIIAKALNCKKNLIDTEKCSKESQCDNCKAITNSNHLDVLEMDAASKTGIDDVRELIELSKYNPTSARYKIFIIDEVHMLSKQAFNGLLKTLEEPPTHLKFIFATTEVKKIPVTIISRCQRFDLNRVDLNLIYENLKKITIAENGNISERAMRLIAKVSEGSVRDSLSLLDRALVSQSIEEKKIDEFFIQKMLGIADKSKTIYLFKLILGGDEKNSIKSLRELINGGVEPRFVLNDFLEIIYFLINIKSLGGIESDPSVTESESKELEEISNTVDASTLIIFWQFIIKTLEELNFVSNEILSLEMFVIRLIHLKDLPSYEEIKSNIFKNNFTEKNVQIKTQHVDTILSNKKNEIKSFANQIKNTEQERPKTELIKEETFSIKNTAVIKNFRELIECASNAREIELKYDLEKNVNLVKFAQGQIDITFNDNLDKNFIRNLTEKLLIWTGNRWVITLTKEMGDKTVGQQILENKRNSIKNEKKNEINNKLTEAFSDADLIEIEDEK